MDIRVRHFKIEPGCSNKIKLYKLQIKMSCTILEIIAIMLLQNDMNVSHYRVMLIYCSKYLHDLNGNDKLSDHGIKKDSIAIIFFQCVMSNDILNP